MQLRIVLNSYLRISRDKHSGVNCDAGQERQDFTGVPCTEYEMS